MLIPSASALPRLANGFSLLSFNVLLPNSQDGWWLYKYYDGVSQDYATTLWPARSKLLAERLLSADADIVLLQECSADSFETDWSFLFDAGYDYAIHTKGRMRPATFWKRERMALCDAAGKPLDCEPSAAVTTGDRTLIANFLLRDSNGAPLVDKPPISIVNAHLSAGQESRRRLQQIHGALDSIRKARAKVDAKGEVSCIVAGDFNSQGRTAVREILEVGEVLPEYRESGDPTEVEQGQNEVTSKPKRQVIGTFADAMEVAHAAAASNGNTPSGGGGVEGSAQEVFLRYYNSWRAIRGEAAEAEAGVEEDQAAAAVSPAGTVPPTLIAPELMSHMVDASGQATPALIAAVDECFDLLSADKRCFTEAEQEVWLSKINDPAGEFPGGVQRGSEYRKALSLREGHENTPLTRADFQELYAEEVMQGKFWGVEHDLALVTGTGMTVPGAAPFTARFDYIYHTTAALALVAVEEQLSARQKAVLFEERSDVLPNAWHPSDPNKGHFKPLSLCSVTFNVK